MQNKNVQENQKRALNINNSIWVSASAGSGKTTILVNRLLILLLNGIELSKIVCITYTKTGASEMKTRIYNKLAEWTMADDDHLTSSLKDLLRKDSIEKELLQRARVLFAKIIDNIEELRILTIHAFCQQILKRFPLEAGILPNFDIIESSNELINQSTNELLQNIKSYPELLEELKEIIKYNNDEQFYELIGKILQEQQSLSIIQDFKYNYKNDIKRIFSLNENEDFDEEKELTKFCSNNDFDCETFLEEVYNSLTDNQKETYSFLEKWKNLNIEERKKEYEKYLDMFLTKKHEKLKRTPKAIEKNENILNSFLDEQQRCFLFTEYYENKKIAKLTVFLINFGLKILDIYKKNKDKKGLLDYNDLIVYTLNLLQNTDSSNWVNYKMDNGIDHILLDEAQDTSKVQWEIISSLTQEFFSGDDGNEKTRTIFVVGDEKQSIFKFQGASPDEFSKNYNIYKNLINNARKIIDKVDLSYSFRSLPNILAFTDKVFQNNNERISNITTEVKHNCIRTNEGISGKVELWPQIEVKDTEEEEESFSFSFEKDNDTKSKELLAMNIALKIKSLIDSHKIISIKGKERNIEYRDIMVLYRTREPIFISYLIRKLNEFNIPNYGLDKINLDNNIIVQDILSVLEFTLFQYDDLNLANLFKSPILDLQEEDLFFICRYKEFLKEKTLFKTMENIVNNENDFLKFINEEKKQNFTNFKIDTEKYKVSFNILNDFIDKSKTLSIYNLCTYIINNYNIKTKFIERFGNDFEEIFKQFLNYVKSFEENNTTNIFNFLQKIKKNKIEIKKTFDSNINQVKLMTVFASKGMQAPIVFLVNSPINNSKESKGILLTEKLLDYKTPIFCLPYNSSKVFKTIKENIQDDNYSEYLRLFYVGMTRAENELYICSSKNKNENKDSEKKDENKRTWYDLAKIAMEEIGTQQNFEFSNGNEDKKFVFTNDKEKFYLIEKDKNKETEIDKNILNNIKKLDIEEKQTAEEEDFQFLKHIDRDNNILSLNMAIIKGNAVHKLLEVLPSANIKDREEIADIYLNSSFFILSQEDKDLIKQKVFNILNNEEYKSFFGKNSKSEVDIIGNINGKNVPKRIDRLVINDDKIIIIDYKNTIHDYDIKTLPIEYKQQLNDYKTLIEKIYTNKKVECYILLTSFIKLIKVY